MRTETANLSEVYPLVPFRSTSGHGVYLEDSNGRRVMDLYGGHAVAALGYAHPRLTEAISRQSEALQFQSNIVELKVRDEAAERLAAFAPAPLERVFFVNSGAEAVENALRIALRSTGRSKVVSMEHAFHGRTAAAAAVSWGSQSWYGFPRTPFEVTFVPRNDVDALGEAVDSETAAVIIEPVQGVAGAFDFSRPFMSAARECCDRSGALLILDEVQTGVGRLGEPFGADLYGIRPDLLTAAKGLGGGFPCAAVLMTPGLAAEIGFGALGSTFGGGPLACAAINTVLDVIESDDLLARVRETSACIFETCVRGPVTGTCGAGLLVGLRTGPRAAAVLEALLRKDILTGTSADPHVLRLLPPLILETRHVKRLARALEELDCETLQ